MTGTAAAAAGAGDGAAVHAFLERGERGRGGV